MLPLDDEAPHAMSHTGHAQCLSSPPQVTRREILLASGGVAACASMPPASSAAVEPQGSAVRTLPVHLTINGKPLDLHIDARQSLLDVLRETLDLMGTKKGCNQGACGACTVLLNGRRVNACLTLAVMHDGAEVTTIEGLARDDELHPLQAAFIAHEGFQCGYCTSGQIMSGIGCIAEGHAHSAEEVRSWMSGNLCRCGAYPGVVAAILDVAGRS